MTQESPKIVTKYHFGEHLRFLNREIKSLEAQLQSSPDDEFLSQRIRELYDLKEAVLLKLMFEHQVKVFDHYYNGIVCVSFKLNRIHTFHLTKTNAVRKALREYEWEQKKTESENGTPETVAVEETVGDA